MKFDTFLATVGDWGKFQKVKYTLICLTYMLPSVMVYTYSFTAATPKFRCVNPVESTNDTYTPVSNEFFAATYKPTIEQCNKAEKHLSLEECQRCNVRTENRNLSLVNGTLTKCNEYVYERKHYTRTLVEEVRFSNEILVLIISFLVDNGL